MIFNERGFTPRRSIKNIQLLEGGFVAACMPQGDVFQFDTTHLSENELKLFENACEAKASFFFLCSFARR